MADFSVISNGNCWNRYARNIGSCDALHICKDMGRAYWYGYGLEIGDHTPTSGERLKSFGRHGNREM